MDSQQCYLQGLVTVTPRVSGLARQMRVRRHRWMAQWRARCRGSPAVLQERSAARKNLPEVSRAQPAAEHLHLARAQAVAPSSVPLSALAMWQVSVPGASYCPLSPACPAAAPKNPPVPKGLRVQAAAARSHLAQTQVAAPWSALATWQVPPPRRPRSLS
jgi:hypothetical protein